MKLKAARLHFGDEILKEIYAGGYCSLIKFSITKMIKNANAIGN